VVVHVAELGDRLGDGPLLWMNGTDHQPPQPWLGRVVAEVNALQDDVELRVVPLQEHLATAPIDGLPTVVGELRSGSSASLLMGVASNRIDVKQAAARAELVLERRAEPLSALLLPAERWPDSLLDVAWLEVIRCSAHDSICACSIDEVVDAVLHRYAEARHIGEGLADRALGALAGAVATDGPVVVNAAARPRRGLVELVVPGETPVAGAQVLEERAGEPPDLTFEGRQLGALLGRIRNQELDPGVYVDRVEVVEDDDGVEVTLHTGGVLREDPAVEEAKRELYAIAGSRPTPRFRVRTTQRPWRRVVARAPEIAGYGWAPWSPAPLDDDPVTVEEAPSGAVTVANGLVTLSVDRADATFAVDGLAGFDRLVDDGDHGDTYNHSPPDHDEVVDAPVAVTIDVRERGPVRAQVVVRRRYSWPERVDDEARARVGRVEVDVTTTVEVRAGEALVRVTAELDNQARDHRLRTWFPLPTRATTSVAECAFGTVHRGTTAEGGSGEHPLPTFPSRRFVQAGGLTVVHEGLLEYELVDIGPDGTAGYLALTLLRATGMLSRDDMTYRPLPAGPPIPLEGPQVRGRHVLRYGVAVGDVDPWALADDLLLPLDVVVGTGAGTGPVEGSALQVAGAQVSSVRRVAGALEVRVFNPSHDAATVTVGGRTGQVVDLRGRPLEPFDGSLDLGPRAIATLLLDEG
jgi:hypothetical protein